MVFRLGELFCGPGGLAYGATHADIGNDEFKIIHSWANDLDYSTCETYIANICPDMPESVKCCDVRLLKMAELGEIDALAFGFPCNDFSIVGEHKGIKGEFGPLYSYGVKALKHFKPLWFLAENVSGLKSANNGKAFKKIINEFENAGYSLTVNLYKFELYGVPQSRHRVIIVGIRNDLHLKFKVPAFEKYKSIDVSCKTALTVPPIPEDAPNNERTIQSYQVIERLSYIKPGENAFTAKIPDHLKLNISGAKISQIYKRLDPNKPAYTVTGLGGGGTHIYHWKEDRALTNRERARLQTFPDNYIFKGNKESVRRQIGMAVPAKGAQIIFEAILKTFAGVEYDYIEPSLK